jgi:hypothetical protein
VCAVADDIFTAVKAVFLVGIRPLEADFFNMGVSLFVLGEGYMLFICLFVTPVVSEGDAMVLESFEVVREIAFKESATLPAVESESGDVDSKSVSLLLFGKVKISLFNFDEAVAVDLGLPLSWNEL